MPTTETSPRNSTFRPALKWTTVPGAIVSGAVVSKRTFDVTKYGLSAAVQVVGVVTR